MTEIEREFVDHIGAIIYGEAPKVPGRNGTRPRWANKAAREVWTFVKARIAAEAAREAADAAEIQRFQE